MTQRHCLACGSDLRDDAKFCTLCGTPTRSTIASDKQESLDLRRSDRRYLAVVAWVYLAVLAGLVVLTRTMGDEVEHIGLVEELLFNGPIILIGFLLLRGESKEALGRVAPLSSIAIAAAIGGAFAVLVDVVMDTIAQWAFDEEEIQALAESMPPLPQAILIFAVAPAILEEVTDRGILWHATRKIASTRVTLLTTSMLFAMMHLPGYGLLGMPHRFVLGLFLGVARQRTDSLLPPIAMHFTFNAVVLLLM